MGDLSTIRTFGDARKIDALIQMQFGSAASLIINSTDLLNADKRANYIKKVSGLNIRSFSSNTPDYTFITNYIDLKGGAGYTSKEFQAIRAIQQNYWNATSPLEAEQYAKEFQKATAAYRQKIEELGESAVFSPRTLKSRAKKAEERGEVLEGFPSIMDLFK